MNKKRQSCRKGLPRQRVSESRSAEAATVAWMLATVATLAAEIAVAVIQTWIILGEIPVDNGKLLEPGAIRLLGVLFLIAVTSGCCNLLLLPLVYRLRQVPPPRLVTIWSCVIGVVPLVTVVLMRTND